MITFAGIKLCLHAGLQRRSWLQAMNSSPTGLWAHACSQEVKPTGCAFVSPLRVHLIDSVTRKHLREYLQARLVSYHEDENGQPTFAPDEQPARASITATPRRTWRPVRGLVTLRTSSTDTTERGVSALLEISAEGNLILWAGANFDQELLKVSLHKICVRPYDDTERKDVFMLSTPSCKPGSAPSVNCFVRDRNKWLSIFRRRGVSVTATAVVDSSA